MRPGDANSAHPPAGLDRCTRDSKISSTKRICRVEYLEPVAEVRTIGSVALHRIGIRQALEGRWNLDRRITEQVAEQPLRQREDVFGADERSFDIDLGELGLPVSTEILVAEAACDLEVSVETGNHQQLLVELRRLGQRIELTRMHPARHQIIACSLGGRLGEHRCLELQIATLVEIPPRALLQTVPENEVLLQLGPTKIEVAMPEAQVFGGQLFSSASRDRDCRNIGNRENLERGAAKLDLAGSYFRVSHFLGAQRDFAFNANHVFLAESRCVGDCGCGSPVRIEGHLEKSGAIAEIDEDYSA